MARRIDGTVAGGFRCDAVGCSLNAIYAVIVVTPYEKEPHRAPIMTFTDVHTCRDHWSSAKREATVTDQMREAIKRIADERGGKPDFDRQWLARINPHHGDYHRFQEMAGLIAPGDQIVKSDMFVPKI